MEPLPVPRALSDADASSSSARGADAGADSDLQKVFTHEAVPMPDDGAEAFTPAQIYAASCPSQFDHPRTAARAASLLGFRGEAGEPQTPRARGLPVTERVPSALHALPDISTFDMLFQVSIALVFCIFILIILFI